MRKRSFGFWLVTLALCASTSAFADGLAYTGFDSWETPEVNYLLRTGGNGVSSVSNLVYRNGDQSAQLYLPDSVADSAAGGVRWNGPLGRIWYSSVWAYVPSGDNTLSAVPYLDYYVDSSQDGYIEAAPTDSLVILAEGMNATDAWVQRVLDGCSLVHVYGNRPGLGAGQFTSGNPGRLDDLLSIPVGGGKTWGDLIVMRARAEAGSWGPEGGQGGAVYTAYVDDYSVREVPEPTTLLLLGSGLIGAAGFMRRKIFG